MRNRVDALPEKLEPVRIGILGCSDIARRRFLPALQKTRNAELVAIASRDVEKAKQWAPAAGCAAMRYEELLSSEQVDLVYLSLPNHLHEEWAMKALEQGKHVIGEKPLALSAEAVARLTGYAEQKGLLLYENIMYLHHPQHHLIKKMIAANCIGKVRSLRTGFAFPLSDRNNFRMKTEQGGGAFLDQARYPLSAALFFLNGATYSFKGHSFFRGDLNVGMNACAVTDAGEVFSCSIGFEQQYECWYEIIGEQGKLRLDRAYTTPADQENTLVLTTGRKVTSIPISSADHFALMVEHVGELILQRKGYQGAHRDAQRLARFTEQLQAGCDRVQLDAEGPLSL